MAKLTINFKTGWLPNDDGLLNTCKCCEETIYANAHELCIVADGIETRWTGVMVCGSCKEVLTTSRHSLGVAGDENRKKMSREKDMEFIAQGQCVSELTVDRCVYCVDTCKASESRKRLKELLDSTGVDIEK